MTEFNPMTAAERTHPLKVTLISHSDMLGGAAVVTFRLMNALRREGINARMVVFTKVSDSENVSVVSTRSLRSFAFMLERARIFMANSFDRKDLFKVSVANIGADIASHPWVTDADVICLNWVNQGMVSLRGIRRLTESGHPVVWTMHDMWCLTGICHHSYGCTRYQHECGSCPLLHSHYRHDLSYRVWRRKKSIYARRRITFIAVSNWLADKAAASSLLGDQDVRVIPNAFPIESFLPEATHTVTSFNINHTRDLILMGAARLDDPIKGLPLAIEALNSIFDNHPEIASSATVIFFGDLRDRKILDSLRFPWQYIGRINDWRMLRQLYASAKVVLSASLYETLPGTLIEGQAAGCLPVSFGEGGQSDIITRHMENGYIARYRDTDDLARGIMWALDQECDRLRLHESVGKRFSSQNIARKYIRLFDELLKKK